MAQTQVVGKSLPRLDAVAKVSGKAIYAVDFALPGMLYGKILRSTQPHALLRRLDASRARQLPGVRAVLSAQDVPLVRYGGVVQDETVFAVDRVRYAGQPVAAVAADRLEIAEAALALIDVEYEPLPIIDNAEAAMRPEAPLVHPDWQSYRTTGQVFRAGNVCARSLVHRGDVDAAMAQADCIFEDYFETQIQHQGYLEPRAAVARLEAGGFLTIWSNTQLPFAIQATLADILQLPVGKIRVIVTHSGGGFGGKLRPGMEPYAALLARATGRPVRLVTTVPEELTAAHPRQPATIYLKTGLKRDGTIVAREGRIIFDTGAFAGSAPAVASVATLVLAGPYRLPHVRLEGWAVYTNKANFGSFRAPSGPQACFAVESHMDIMARHMGLDPLAFRLKNLVQEGDTGVTGQVLTEVSIRQVLERAAAAIDWGKPAGPQRGKGLACGWWTVTGGSSGVYVKLNADGTVVLNTGAAEIGTAAVTAGAAQILAEELGVRLADITVVSADTDSTPYDLGAQGSRTTFAVGSAARQAAAEIKAQLLRLAAEVLDMPVQRLLLRDRAVLVADDPERRVSLAALAQLSLQQGGGIMAHGTFIAPKTPFDPATVSQHFYPTFNTPSFHAHAAEVEVDRDTGAITVQRYVVAQDVGFAINPQCVEGQLEGGVAQGVGQALSEEIIMRDGRVLPPGLIDYKMPSSLDVPVVETILVQHPSRLGPYGAKGVGEPPAIEPPAAIANAIADAVGVRLRHLPMTAEKVRQALQHLEGD
jgi:CO/xanthine dehydrogenase Mo-binding subunit